MFKDNFYFKKKIKSKKFKNFSLVLDACFIN